MRVTPLVQSSLLYGALALVVGAVLVFYARDAPPKLPAATVRGAGALRRALVRVAPWIALVVGSVGAIWIYTQSTAIIVVSDDGGRPTARRLVQLGGGALEGHVRADEGEPSDGVWVVNQSTHVVRVETVEYGAAIFGGAPATIPPGITMRFRAIDHVGPDDPPPASVPDRAGVHTDDRTWLTWD